MVQVGQLLTNLRVSSSNMLLPFTAQILHLLEDSPAATGTVTTDYAPHEPEQDTSAPSVPLFLDAHFTDHSARYTLQALP